MSYYHTDQKLGDILQNKLPIFFKSLKSMKDKEKLKSHSRLRAKKLYQIKRVVIKET